MNKQSKKTVIRVIEYDGPLLDVERTINKSLKDGNHHFGNPDFRVRVTTLTKLQHIGMVDEVLREIGSSGPAVIQDDPRFAP